MEALNITDITNRLFDLALPMAEVISNARAPLGAPDPEALYNRQQLAAWEDREVEIVSREVVSFLGPELAAILPEAAVCYRGDSLPESECTWVVTPYSRRMMGLTFTSIALQQGDDLPLGIFYNWEAQQVVTGERGGGANIFEESLHVSEQALSPHSTYIFHLPDVSGTDAERAAFRDFSGRHGDLMAYLEKAASQTRPAYNGVMENVPGSVLEVAAGRLDFTMASGFKYTDVAAAIAIVEEAGGVCTDFSGGRTGLLDGSELFCSNRVIHAAFLAAAKQ